MSKSRLESNPHLPDGARIFERVYGAMFRAFLLGLVVATIAAGIAD
jgi:hypothetical protein